MQPSASGDFLLGAVEASMQELEMLCGRAERALMLRRWEDLDQAIADSRRATHALQNAMYDSKDVRKADFDARIMHRLRHVAAIRENQMTRLQQYHDAVGERLQLIARWKSALKSMAGRRVPKQIAAVDRLS